MKFVLLYMFGVHFSTNKAHITIHKFSLIFLYKRGCVPYLRHLFLGFVSLLLNLLLSDISSFDYFSALNFRIHFWTLHFTSLPWDRIIFAIFEV